MKIEHLWVTKDGRTYRVQDLACEHLQNIIRVRLQITKRLWKKDVYIIYILLKEAIRRRLSRINIAPDKAKQFISPISSMQNKSGMYIIKEHKGKISVEHGR